MITLEDSPGIEAGEVLKQSHSRYQQTVDPDSHCREWGQ